MGRRGGRELEGRREDRGRRLGGEERTGGRGEDWEEGRDLGGEAIMVEFSIHSRMNDDQFREKRDNAKVFP